MDQNEFAAYISSLELNQQLEKRILADLSAKYKLIPLSQLQNSDLDEHQHHSTSEPRTLSVIGSGEFSLPPDRIKLKVAIKSQKEELAEAKHSVHRRFEYVYQTLRKFQIKVCVSSFFSILAQHSIEMFCKNLKEDDINVTKSLTRANDGGYEAITEVDAIMDDLGKYLQVQNFLVEKLDKNVHILEPIVFYSRVRLDNIK